MAEQAGGAGWRYRLGRPALPERSAVLAALAAALDGPRLTQGPQVEALEAEVASRCGVAHCVAVSSCTLGISMVARALGLAGEVVVPSFTFVATAQALAWAGVGLALTSSDEASFTLDVASAEAALGPSVEAICAVNVFGAPPPMASLEALASRRGLALISDSAQGLGSRVDGRASGSFGAAEVFSLSPNKVVTAVEGGLITTGDEALASRLRGMRDYGRYPGGAPGPPGVNGRMSELHAAVGRVSLARLDEEVATRRALMDAYRAALAGVSGVSLQALAPGVESCGTFAGVRLPEGSRERVAARLASQGVETRAYFAPPLHAHPARAAWRWRGAKERLDAVDAISRQMLCLPLHSGLTRDDVEVIAQLLRAALEEG